MKPGVILDNRYQMVRLLGKGSMGAVWQGNDLKLNRSVAVKVVLDHTDPVLVERMGREATAAGRLSHPHIVTVHDFGQAAYDGETAAYIVMELVDGRPLTGVLADGMPQLSVALDWARQIALALGAAHAPGVGVVHRDLKPDNVLITGDGLVKLVDFGIARFIGEHGDERTLGKRESGTAAVAGAAGSVPPAGAPAGDPATDGAGGPGRLPVAGGEFVEYRDDWQGDDWQGDGGPGDDVRGDDGEYGEHGVVGEHGAYAALGGLDTLSGTPAYMAPEQCLCKPVDHRTDLYALGCLLYEMVTGTPPFAEEGSPLAVAVAHVHDAPPAPRSRNDSLSVELDTLILDLLAKDPDARPADAASVYRRLGAIATGLHGAALAGVTTRRPHPCPPPPSAADDPGYAALLRHYGGGDIAGAGRPPAEVVRLWWAAAADLTELRGPHDEQTLTARRALARHVGAAGDHALAISLWQELIPDLQFACGHFHRTTFTAQRLLAWHFGAAGRPAEAVRLLLELIPDATRLLGRRHQDVLEARRFLVWNIGELGRHARAVRLLSKLVPDLNEALGERHEHTLEARRMLAWNTEKSGHHVRAIGLLRDLVPDAARALGAGHEQSVEARRLLAEYTR
ncbi:serine/threonine-protein kinase [Streptomyces sp. NBC_01476]|uniref:serine/threonine-protein kinase n=1 Tax=Streptomyces sp. NBC_01476 TaxID=2903881 RepID=UPI002E359466|nr:serine/threonine-protein kinase [Streptomyces sp. NBC_01476]